MKFDAPLLGALPDAARNAREVEDAGYDGVFTFEGPHDPFFPLALAAEHTERIDLATAIAVAFARNPMTLANIGYDLQLLSKGRFVLGLGSQIRPHIERRFSMPWSHPAARMREMTQAIRAIWDAWQDGTPLRFEGEFYRHTLMTPFFDPGPNPYGRARIWLAGVGPRMTEVAGEVADGFLVHPFCTERYLREHIRPALERGHAAAGGARDGFEIAFPTMTVIGDTDEETAAAERDIRSRIAFYGSTPAYAPVLDVMGWGELHPELNRLSKEGRWPEMVRLVPEDMIDAFAVRGTRATIADAAQERYGGLVDRVALTGESGLLQQAMS
ncbi:MAG: TIGR03617 family F420-dependent LLM class oxidoreductase [Acidimicrobiia bacterium]